MKRFLYVILLILPVIAMIGFGLCKKWHVGLCVAHGSQLSIEQAQLYIENKLGKKADFFVEEGVFKISIARTDITVTVDDFPLDPFMGLTTWIGFQKGIKKGVEIMAMGDWALLEHEVHPVMSAALDHNIKITAVHNHFLGAKPRIYFMHMEVEGAIKDVAAGIYAMLGAAENISTSKQLSLPSEHAIDGGLIERIIPVKGIAKDGMFKIVIGRTIKASCGCPVGKNMGINSWIAFAGTDKNAIVDGDFALFEDELQPVLKELNRAGIHIVAIHNHMVHEQPRLLYVHFWARGKIDDITQGLKGAIDQTTMLSGAQVTLNSKQYPCKGCGRNK